MIFNDEEHNPDAVLQDIADIPDIQERCVVCGEIMYHIDGKYICPACNPDLLNRGDDE